MASWKTKAVPALGLLIGLAAGFAGSYLYWQHQLQRIKEGWTLSPVVVFDKTMPPGTTLAFEQMAKLDIPENFITPGMITPGQLDQFVGRKLLFPVDRGNYLMVSMLEEPGS